MMQTSFALLRRARPLWRRPSLPTFAAPLSTLQRADSTFSLSEDDEEENAQFARGHAQWLRLSTTFDAEQVAALSQMLAATGARSRADVGEFVHERDLIAAGASLVDSRRLLMGAAIPPSQTSTMMRPQAALKEAAEAGLARGQRGSGVIFTSSVLGGMMLSFGGAMYVVMGGGNPLMAEMLPGMHKIASASVFPVGLSMVVFTGTDLLTSNMMYHTLPFLTHQHRNVSLATASRVWSISFAGNLVGSIAIAAAASSYLFTGDPYVTWLANVANAKVSMAMPEAFVRAVGANWLVNVAIFMALSSRSAIGKLAALWIPITTFVSLGLEHCVANMFLIPLGLLSGAAAGGVEFAGHAALLWSPETFADDFAVAGQLLGHNLLPVVAGNFVGATVFMSMLPYYTDWYTVGAENPASLPPK